MPWIPESTSDWHADLSRSLNQKARLRGTHDQGLIDSQIIIAAGLRLLRMWEIDELPRGDAEDTARERNALLDQLREEIIAGIESSVPFHLKRQSEVHLRTDLTWEERTKLLQDAIGEETPQQEGPAEKKQPRKKVVLTPKAGAEQQSQPSSSSSGWGSSTWWSRTPWWQQR